MLTSGCGRDLNSAQGVADEFVDQRFVQFDLGKAKLYAVSIALEKVKMAACNCPNQNGHTSGNSPTMSKSR